MRTHCTRYLPTLGLFFLLLQAHASPSDLAPAPIEHRSAITYKGLDQAVRHQINRHVIFPIFGDAEAMYGTVEVSFAVNTEGRLEVVSARSENRTLLSYVLKQLTRVQVAPNPSGLWRTSRIRFTFRPQ